MELKFYVNVYFIDTYKENDMGLEFTVQSDSINHAWLKSVNYIKSLGLDPDLIDTFNISIWDY